MTVHGGAGVVVRDDRTWPRGAAAFSAVVVLGSLVAVAWSLATASQGRAGLVVDAVGFVVVLGLSLWLFHHAFDALLGGRRQPGWSVLAQVGTVVVGFVAMGYDARLGTAVLAGLFAGMFAMNLVAIRRGRGNRAAVDAHEAEQVRSREAEVAARAPARDSRPAVDVAGVLDAAWRDAGQRWIAWLVAGAVVTTATVLLTGPGSLASFMVPFMSGGVLLWVTRAAWSVGLARRDFRLARTAPERAWVVLLDDPTPRMVRPLLGVWSEEPVVSGSRFPRPELVFRCDDDLDDLLSSQGSVEVHEAWVDTSGRGMRGARWVAADGGVALPHRRAVFGRWFFSSFTRAEQPPPAHALTTARPDPNTPSDPSTSGDAGSALVTRVLWRGGALAVLAVACVFLG